MASIAKLPLACCCLHLVDRGVLDLDGNLPNPGGDVSSGSEVRSVAEALTRAMVRSDNRCADLLYEAVGGTEAVGHWLDESGFGELRPSRTIRELLVDADWRELRTQPRRLQFFADPRDSATADAIVRFLTALWNDQLLTKESSAWLFRVMRACATEPTRLPYLLPATAVPARKTGTLRSCVSNDVGIIRLPGGEHVALAILLAKPQGTDRPTNLASARIARGIYDYFR